jgi:hypothetical protein
MNIYIYIYTHIYNKDGTEINYINVILSLKPTYHGGNYVYDRWVQEKNPSAEMVTLHKTFAAYLRKKGHRGTEISSQELQYQNLELLEY